jgi:TolB-like protein
LSLFNELKRRNVIKVTIAYIVMAWLVMQVADVILNNIVAPGWIFHVLLLFLAIGLPFAVFFAWAFEMTPEGIKRESDVDRSQSITTRTGRKLDFLIIGVLVLGLGYFAYDKFVVSAGREAALVEATTQAVAEQAATEPKVAANSSKSIAILPFVNMSADKDNEYFSDGISEELLNALVKVNELRVASRTSAFAYKGKEVPITQIARELGVDHILEGSVRKAGNRVRITAQLIDGETDRHLWSKTYERELIDLFNIQEEISNNIVDALKIVLDVDESAAMNRAQRPTDNLEAYELYLRGRYQWRTRRLANIRNAIALFEQAIELDPKFARAYEALASAHGVLPTYTEDVTREESTLAASQAAQKALELDPSLAEAHTWVAEAYGQQHRWSDFLNEYNLAVKSEPRNATARMWFAEVLGYLGYASRAMDEAKLAYALDPASPALNFVFSYISMLNGELEQALKHQKIADSLGIHEMNGYNFNVHLQRGEWQQALTRYTLLNEVPVYIEACFQATQDPTVVPVLRQKLAQMGTHPVDGMMHAFCQDVAGDLDGAMDSFEAVVMEDTLYLNYFWRQTAQSRTLRTSERFKTILHKLNLVDFYRVNGWPDRCRPVGDNDFECDQ